MTKVGLIKFLIFYFAFFAAYGQKVKYKDIFGLLSTKQYDQAEPFLKRYLIDNDDNPNAYLFMGIIYQEKSSKADILKQTALTISYMDSANFYYDKALKTIDDREVRKNKELYQAYNRRDLRTGEFGVKLSDIQFDIEKKIEGLKERIDKVKMVKYYFSLADSLYKKSNALYRSLQAAYPSERQMYLRAEENALKSLTNLSVKFDSCTRAFENYKASSTTLGRSGYNHNLTLVEISNFKTEGESTADFFQEDLKLWDYKKFADKAKNIIEKEIIPMQESMVNYDIEINKLRETLNTDSVSVRKDLAKVINKSLYEQLKKYDPEPLPMEVFGMKIADLEYRSAIQEHIAFKDSADVHLKLNMINTEMLLLHKLDSISGQLSSEDIDQKALDYGQFITNTYSNTIVLRSYVKALNEYAQREKRKKVTELAIRQEAMNWLVEGADSIPLVKEKGSARFKPLFTENEKYTLGLNVTDTANAEGYFYIVTPSRKPGLAVKFPVDKAAFRLYKLPGIKALTYSDPGGQVYYVLLYSDQLVKEKYPATLAKIYRSDGLAWSNNYQLSFVPSALTFKGETGELTVGDQSQQMVVDKNGKVIK